MSILSPIFHYYSQIYYSLHCIFNGIFIWLYLPNAPILFHEPRWPSNNSVHLLGKGIHEDNTFDTGSWLPRQCLDLSCCSVKYEACNPGTGTYHIDSTLSRSGILILYSVDLRKKPQHSCCGFLVEWALQDSNLWPPACRFALKDRKNTVITHDFQAIIGYITRNRLCAKKCKNKRENANTIIEVGNFAGTFCERMISKPAYTRIETEHV